MTSLPVPAAPLAPPLTRDQVESARLAALAAYRLLDQPVDDELTAIVRVAAAVADVPYATLNLLDEQRQCQLTTVGFDGADSPRADSMCDRHFLAAVPLQVEDASRHPDYAANRWVTGDLASVRFYASFPLVTDQGHVLGTLCVFDMRPQVLRPDQMARLEDLARVLLALFERRREARVRGHLAAAADEQRQLADLALQELEARYELTDAVLETIDVGVVVSGADGHPTLANRAARELSGLDLDAPATTWHLRTACGSRPLRQDELPLSRVLAEGSVTGLEVTARGAGGGDTRLVASGRALVTAEGAVRGAVVALTDVTAERRQQDVLAQAHADLTQRSAELERSNTELEQFAGVASHDLLSPLTVLAGYVELLQDCYGEALDEQGVEWLTTVARSADRMRDLITSLLSYARAGNDQCRRARTDVSALTRDALADLLAGSGGDGTTDLDPAPDVVVGELGEAWCDPTLVRQLLQNLLGNALKYRHPERRLRLVVGTDADQPAEGAVPGADADERVYAVADNGIGIPVGDRERVFGMFARVGEGHRSGLGIGLATCQRIVERHGGRIWVEGTPGGGTTVRFTLPQRGRAR